MRWLLLLPLLLMGCAQPDPVVGVYRLDVSFTPQQAKGVDVGAVKKLIAGTTMEVRQDHSYTQKWTPEITINGSWIQADGVYVFTPQNLNGTTATQALENMRAKGLEQAKIDAVYGFFEQERTKLGPGGKGMVCADPEHLKGGTYTYRKQST